jgi:hypothetical protein
MNRPSRSMANALAIGLYALAALFTDGAAAGSRLKSDERVLLFPAYGIPSADGGWLLHIRGWVFEPVEDSALRGLLTGSIAAYADIPEQGEARALFDRRMAWFLVDNERGKVLHLRLGDQRLTLAPTQANGHTVNRRLPLAACPLPDPGPQGCSGWVELRLAPEHRRTLTGRLRLIPREGLSVISDIDDTIKVSHVADARRMLRSALLEPFRPVPGMSELYHRWQARGALFHYLSSSPWQLYAPLSEFVAAEGFPEGIYHLMQYRLKDETLLNLFRSSYEKKLPVLERLLNDFPGHRFILVGDSGEQDPEVYAELARTHPAQVKAIHIRAVQGSDLSAERWHKAFRGLDPGLWRVFADPEEIPVAMD